MIQQLAPDAHKDSITLLQSLQSWLTVDISTGQVEPGLSIKSVEAADHRTDES